VGAEASRVAHGGPGSRTEVVSAGVPVLVADAPVQGELSHGGLGSRADYVRPTAPRQAAEVRIADVAHGTAGSVVSAVAARS
jgi:hypothetical protein